MADDDPCHELSEAMKALQTRINEGRESFTDLLDDAVALAKLASEPRFADCSARVCGHDKLISVYQAIDSVTYAPAILDAATRMRSLIDATHPCYACLTGARVRALRDLGDHVGAVAEVQHGRDAYAFHELLVLYRRTFLEQMRMELALDPPDPRAARSAFAALEAIEHQTSRWAQLSDNASVQLIARNTAEMIRECRVFVALAEGDVDLAIEHYAADVAHDEPSGGRLLLQLALIEAMTPAHAARVPELVLEAWVYCQERGRLRDQARIGLAVLERGLSDDPCFREGLRALELPGPSLDERMAAALA